MIDPNRKVVKADELMIGNYVLIDDKKKPPYVYQVAAHGIEEIEGWGNDEWAQEHGNTFGVPLTPEILGRCGFEKHIHNEVPSEFNIYMEGWKLGNMILYRVRDSATSNDWFYEVEYSPLAFDERINIVKRIDHLHQLQVLYFALTGSHLTFKQQ